MRTGRVPLAALLLVLASPVLQVSSTNDIYWEGEEDASNEFLEVKHEEPTVLDNLKRFKRQWNPFSFFDSPKEEETETATDAVPDDNGSYGKDDADLDIGSGVPDKSDSEPREKTLRVTFLVMEPYITAYSNRDSPEFLNISRSLANAVDLLYESLPGTQRSSLVRIQSLVNDDFLCKVTLDIVTTRNEDTDTITDILRNHIKNNGRLGETSVRDGDFSAQLIDPGTTFDCDFNEFTCDENICLPLSIKCDGRRDCRDGTDEYDCPVPDTSEAPPPTEETPVDYDNNIDDKDDQLTGNENPDERTSYDSSTPDDRNPYGATPETPSGYDGTPDNGYNQTLENPYERENPYDTGVSPDNRNPYDENADPDRRDDYGRNVGPDHRDPYSTDADQVNQDPYGPGAGPDNRYPYDPDDRNPVASTSETPSPGYDDQESGYWPRGDLGGANEPTSTDTPEEPATKTDTDIYDATTSRIYNECPSTHIRCDETRCVEATRRCDGISDCVDGTDEAGCPSHALRLTTEEPWSEYQLMHQEFQQLRTEVAQLKVALFTSNEQVHSLTARLNALELKLEQTAPPIKNPGESNLAELKFQLNKRDQKLIKNVKITGIPQDKVISIKLVVTADENTRNAVETPDGSITLSISADLAAQRSRSISMGYARPTAPRTRY